MVAKATPRRRTKQVAPVRLDLACGQNRREGFTGIDCIPGDGVDLVVDLVDQRPWPFEDGSVDELHCSHFVEHLTDLCGFMDEAWRIAKDGATFTILHPYYTSIRAWQDPTHVRAINEVTWYYFSRAWRELQRLDHYPVACDWEVVSITTQWNEPWNLKSEEARQFALAHYFNVVSDLTVILKANK